MTLLPLMLTAAALSLENQWLSVEIEPTPKLVRKGLFEENMSYLKKELSNVLEKNPINVGNKEDGFRMRIEIVNYKTGSFLALSPKTNISTNINIIDKGGIIVKKFDVSCSTSEPLNLVDTPGQRSKKSAIKCLDFLSKSILSELLGQHGSDR